LKKIIEDHMGEDEIRGTNNTHEIKEKNTYEVFVGKT
jgi:hypothetical protein